MLLPKGAVMHISEGVLSIPVLSVGAVAAAVGVAAGLRALRAEDMPKTALFASAFFVASLIYVPIPPGSVHLVLNGLMGLVLGTAAFPAIFAALLLQAFFFHFGGVTVLGVNTCIMALPPVICGYIFLPLLRKANPVTRRLAAFACGSASILLSGLLAATALVLSGAGAEGVNFTASAVTLLAAHAPLALLEGAITVLVVAFVERVRPEFLHIAPPARG